MGTTHTESVTVRASAAISSAAGTTYSSSIRTDRYEELTLFLRVTAQGTWTDETITISVQTQDPAGNFYDLTGATFTVVGDKTSAVPYAEDIAILAFGSNIRLKYVTTGTAVNYTFSVTAIGKGDF